MRSIELVLDASSDSLIRADWSRLAAAGVPSQAGHTSPSNSPHITLAAGPDLTVQDLAVPDNADGLWQELPLALEFSGIQVFTSGAGKYVLARSVVVTAALLDLHRALHEWVAGALPLTMPDAWTPHVTLARRVPGHLLGTALDLLELRTEGQCTAARHWDSTTRTITSLGPFGQELPRVPG
jgi:2'-5' RNA ligase